MRRGSKKNRLLDYWVGIPALNLAATFHRRKKHLVKAPGKLGVMCSPALGDTLLFSSALQDFRSAFPAAEIVHCCMAPNKSAAAIIPGADRRVVLDLTRPYRSLRLLRSERFDLFVDYTSWQRLTAFLTLFSCSGFTAGFDTPGMHRARGYDVAVEHSPFVHEVENFRQLTRSLGVSARHPPAISAVSTYDLVRVWPEPPGKPLTLLHLWPSGQRSWLREWPEDRWLELAAALRDRVPDTVFGITGTHAELPRTERFVAKLHAAGLPARPVLASLPQLAALIRRARLVVSVNTGVMHIAAIAGAPTVSINGPNSNRRWGPVGPNAIGVEAPGEGCGFLHLGFDFDGKPTDCMERISVLDVLNACNVVAAPSVLAQTVEV